MLGHMIRLAGFRADVYPVKNILLDGRVVSRLLIAFIPVGIFDDELQIRIDPMRFGDDLFGELLHLFLTEIFPAALSLFGDAQFAAAGCEEIVIQDDLIKHLRRFADDPQILLPVRGIAEAECIEQRRLLFSVNKRGARNPAGYLDTVTLKDLLDLFQSIFRDIRHAPVILHIYLGKRQIPQVCFDIPVQLPGGYLQRVVRVYIRRRFKMDVSFHGRAPCM